MSTGAELIAAERARQIAEEGWAPSHDDGHRRGELVVAAMRYAAWDLPRPKLRATTAQAWPWARQWWKPSGFAVRNLVKAGALIAAEIDRLERKAKVGGRRP